MLSPTIDRYEQSVEKRFALDEEQRFRVNAKAVRLFAHWAADKLGLRRDEADTYAESLIDLNCRKAGFDSVVAHVFLEMEKKELEFTEEDLHERLTLHREEAYLYVHRR